MKLKTLWVIEEDFWKLKNWSEKDQNLTRWTLKLNKKYKMCLSVCMSYEHINNFDDAQVTIYFISLKEFFPEKVWN